MQKLYDQEEYFDGIGIVDLFDPGSCSKLKAKEAENLFNKYISDIPIRIMQLFYLTKEERDKIKLDFSPESLIPLWDWFERNSVFETTEIPFHKRNISTNYTSAYDLPTPETYKTALCVSDYYGTVVIKNADQPLQWKYFVRFKKMPSVNQPVIFSDSGTWNMNPRAVIHDLILRSNEEGFDKERLYKVYKHAMKYL